MPTDSRPDAALHSEYVPRGLKGDALDAFREEMLREWELMTKLGELRPAPGDEEADDTTTDQRGR